MPNPEDQRREPVHIGKIIPDVLYLYTNIPNLEDDPEIRGRVFTMLHSEHERLNAGPFAGNARTSDALMGLFSNDDRCVTQAKEILTEELFEDNPDAANAVLDLARMGFPDTIVMLAERLEGRGLKGDANLLRKVLNPDGNARFAEESPHIPDAPPRGEERRADDQQDGGDEVGEQLWRGENR